GLAEAPPAWGWFDCLRMPAVALSAAALLVALVAGFFLARSPAPALPLATIQLAAMRGDMPSIQAARATQIELTDTGGFHGRVELVDESGAKIWNGVTGADGSFRVNKPLAAGAYFVRLYEDSRLAHEYGFRVR